MILKHDSYKKDPNKEQKYNPVPKQLDDAGAEEDVPTAGRCCTSSHVQYHLDKRMYMMWN
jgi:hypothetical protein